MPLSADEPIRALVALDMMLNGNYIAPKMNGTFYVNKPPVYNWIIILFFKLFRSFDEWVFRLPSVLSLLAFGVVIFKVVKHQLKDIRFAWIAAIAGITGGNLWIYSAYLGHIDITYSVVSFLQIYLLYHFAEKGNWTKAFVFSYSLACVGFMMKGLPTIVFQGSTLITMLILKRDFKRLWSRNHLLSILLFAIPVGLYFWTYSLKADIGRMTQMLIHESSSRTVTDKSLLESLSHLFVFPLRYILDILPWGLSVLVFIRKDARQYVWANKFLKTSLLLFLVNIIVYWLSPDYRARYVFMLTPFLLIPSLSACVNIWTSKQLKPVGITISILLVLSPIGMYFIALSKIDISIYGAVVLVAVGLIILGFMMIKLPKATTYLVVFGMIIARFGYSTYVVPFRVQTGPYLKEKVQGKAVAKITKGEELGMYNSNVALTMNWYISIDKQRIINVDTSDYNFNSYYLVPTEVIKDTSNVNTYYTFVRRYESKPISLVKFKYRFPEMPKKKK
jgi:4-amino-4-deoxy-L-arabinose transferase-like glycosyltransferase